MKTFKLWKCPECNSMRRTKADVVMKVCNSCVIKMEDVSYGRKKRHD